MQCKIGKIPQNIIDKSNKKKYFFKQNGLMKGCKYPLLYKPFYHDIKKRFNNLDNSIELNNIIDLLTKMFEYNPNKRFKAIDCIKHPYFNKGV